jgi:hypothetical protein
MVLNQAFRRAVQLDLIARNPMEAVEPPRTPRIERPSLTIEQAGVFFTATRSDRMYGHTKRNRTPAPPGYRSVEHSAQFMAQ